MHKIRIKRNSSKDTAGAGRPTVAAEDWKDLPLSDRISVISKLRCAGNSNRSIGRMLGVDEGTVRRLRRIAVLPESGKQAIAKGASANQVLAEAGKSTIEPPMQREELVSRYAAIIVSWLQEHDIVGPYAERVLLDVDGGFPRLGRDKGSRPPSFAHVAAVIQNCRPVNLQDREHHLNPFIDWGMRWISRVVPRDLLTRVMAEARNFVVANPCGGSVLVVGSEQLA